MLDLTINHVLLMVFITWHYALRCGFISDDHSTIERRKDIIPDEERKDRGETYLVKVFNDGVVMYYMDKVMRKLRLHSFPFIWHGISLSLHLANTYMLYLFLSQHYGWQIAIGACLFWGVNPMLNQNAVWVSGRPYLIGVFLTLIGFLNWQNPLIFIPCYVLAVITNLAVALAPILLGFIYKWAWPIPLYIISIFMIGIPFIIWKFNKRFKKALVLDRANFKFRLRKINTFVRLVAYYIYSFFVPVKMGWYHQAGFRYNERWEKFNIYTLGGYIITGGLLLTGIPGYWFLLGFLPVSNVYATNSFIQDRYIYFCSIGISILVASLYVYNPTIFYCLITFYATKSYSYSRHMKNDEELYRENWRNHPLSDYAVNNLTFFLIHQKRYDEARVMCLRGLEINRNNKMLWYNLGVTWAAQGNFVNDEGKFKFIKAVDCWKMALQIEPRWAKPGQDLKKLIKILVEKKVLSLHAKEGEQKGKAFSISVPAIKGLKEACGGT